ncbi:MAG: CoA-transferase [Sphingomonadaceae bacterium]|nr:CoA-transferase [Sphingomonadaceae bacterium]
MGGDAAGSVGKLTDLDAAISGLSSGMTLGIGGWATRRKPMALARAIARSPLTDLTVVAYGGPEIGLLAATGKLKKLIFGFVSMDHFPLEPHFRAARQAGTLEVLELDEGLVHWGLRAAAMRMPFLPSRIGVGTSIVEQPGLKMVRSPYDDGEQFLAMPALKLDAALIHVNRADKAGNCTILATDPFFDELMARAANKVIIQAEQIVDTDALGFPEQLRFQPFERSVVTQVVHAPYGAHPTAGGFDYGIDLAHLKAYSASAGEGWDDYRTRYVEVDPAAYLEAVGGADHVRSLAAAIY